MTRQRAEIDDQYQWDPTTIYETADAAEREYEAAMDRLEVIREALEADPDDPATLVSLLERFEELVAARTRLVLFAEVRRTMDLTDETARERRDRVRALEADVEAVTTDLREYLREHDRLAEWRTEDDDLAPFDRFLENATRGSGGNPALTGLLERFGDVLDGHDRVLTAICDEDFEPPTVEGPDGDSVTVRWYGRGQLLKDPDREFRRQVYTAFHDALDERANAIATAWIEKLRTRARLADA